MTNIFKTIAFLGGKQLKEEYLELLRVYQKSRSLFMMLKIFFRSLFRSLFRSRYSAIIYRKFYRKSLYLSEIYRKFIPVPIFYSFGIIFGITFGIIIT